MSRTAGGSRDRRRRLRGAPVGPRPRRAALSALVATIAGLADAGSASASAATERCGQPGVAVIAAAGDIACERSPCAPQRATTRLLARLDPTAVLPLGDLQYPDGALEDFMASYDLTWGRFIDRTFPVPGNHEYARWHDARGYFDYFGRRAHERAGGTYSYELARWHLVAINTGHGAPSREGLSWIERDLRRDRHRCELAYWHHPRWSSSSDHGSSDAYAELWTVLYRAGVDVVLNAHDHNYERFQPLAPSGAPSEDGIREFVVGTGGADLVPFGDVVRGSQVRITAHGVLAMRLKPAGYGWTFLGVGGGRRDAGRTACHT